MKLKETTIRSFLTKEVVILRPQNDLIYLYLHIYKGQNYKRVNAFSFQDFGLGNYFVSHVSDEEILK